MTDLASFQAAPAVVMVRPHCFTPNPETAADNAFQQEATAEAKVVAERAHAECSAVAAALESHGVTVHLFEDDGSQKTPDSVFPNNWFSAHADGLVALYPMYAPSRRKERRHDIIDLLKDRYQVTEVIDFSAAEHEDLFLEGTGAMVLDHVHRVAYTAKSHRADGELLERFCDYFGYEPALFDTKDNRGVAIYHANVMMCVGTDFVMISLDCISDEVQRDEVREKLTASGRDIVELTLDQLDEFAGNALELTGNKGRILAISARALKALTAEQVQTIEKSCTIVPLEVPTIELAGGSVRCMLAGIHTVPRS